MSKNMTLELKTIRIYHRFPLALSFVVVVVSSHFKHVGRNRSESVGLLGDFINVLFRLLIKH